MQEELERGRTDIPGDNYEQPLIDDGSTRHPGDVEVAEPEKRVPEQQPDHPLTPPPKPPDGSSYEGINKNDGSKLDNSKPPLTEKDPANYV